MLTQRVPRMASPDFSERGDSSGCSSRSKSPLGGGGGGVGWRGGRQWLFPSRVPCRRSSELGTLRRWSAIRKASDLVGQPGTPRAAAPRSSPLLAIHLARIACSSPPAHHHCYSITCQSIRPPHWPVSEDSNGAGSRPSPHWLHCRRGRANQRCAYGSAANLPGPGPGAAEAVAAVGCI